MATRNPPVIDLVSSDDEDEDASNMAAPDPEPALPLQDDAVGGADVFDVDMMNFGAFFEMPGGYPEEQMAAVPPREPSPPRQGQVIVIDGEDVFIPDSPRAIRPEPTLAQQQEALNQDAMYAQETANFTADVCLKRVLAMFPDIAHEHVVKLYNDYDAQGAEALPGGARLEAIVEKLLSGDPYPRQPKPLPNLKRKRTDSTAEQGSERWEGPDREVAGPAFRGAIATILKVEFPDITKAAIDKALLANHHLYPTYLALAKMKDTCDVNKKWTGRPSRDLTSAESLATHCGWPAMPDELEAARKHVKDVRRQRVIEDAKIWAEKKNLQRAIDANETAQCQACFDDLPMNRQMYCDGDTAHFTCFDCATAYVKSEVGDSRCRVLCTAGCGAAFARPQLHLLEDKALLEKLEQLQQEKEIREAGLDDLEECPFCDYKAILPPVEEDFEFRCANELCEKVSCRRCKAVSHVPMSCEEHAKEHKLSSRHKIEEAMTKALIRNCAKCRKGFIKEYGCNKMSCPSCGNLQCYVCSKSLKDYNHFDQMPRGASGNKSSKCPLYDNVEERHEREIKVAEAAARAEVISENPDVSEQDLEIKLSDAVKKAIKDRVTRAGAVPGGIPPGYGGPAGARFGAGLFMPDEDAGEHAEQNARMQELLRIQQQRLDAQRLAQPIPGMNDLGETHQNAAQGPGPGRILGQGLRAFAGAIGQRAFAQLPPLQHPPARAPPMLPAIPGGFNEDPFGGEEDGDPYALHRLLLAGPGPLAALPVRDPRPRRAAPIPAIQPGIQPDQDRVREMQQRVELLRNQHVERERRQEQRAQQVPEAEQLRQLEAEALEARQRFDDRRGGQGRVFRRDALDPRRHYGPGGWPGQN